MPNLIYERVSTKSQDTKSQTPDLKRWEAAHGKARWFKDRFTGTTMERPSFASLMDAVSPGDTIIVWRLDRLGRTAKGLTALFEDLYRRKINLVSLKDGIDLATPAGRLMANVLASVAAYETEVRSERVRAGQAVARANGKHIGRTAGIHTPIKVTGDHRRLARQMQAEGKKIAVIARTLTLSRDTTYKILRDPS
jgi:DNA invertase Pin-like site-specific DNA recombinase